MLHARERAAVQGVESFESRLRESNRVTRLLPRAEDFGFSSSGSPSLSKWSRLGWRSSRNLGHQTRWP